MNDNTETFTLKSDKIPHLTDLKPVARRMTEKKIKKAVKIEARKQPSNVKIKPRKAQWEELKETATVITDIIARTTITIAEFQRVGPDIMKLFSDSFVKKQEAILSDLNHLYHRLKAVKSQFENKTGPISINDIAQSYEYFEQLKMVETDVLNAVLTPMLEIDQEFKTVLYNFQEAEKIRQQETQITEVKDDQ